MLTDVILLIVGLILGLILGWALPWPRFQRAKIRIKRFFAPWKHYTCDDDIFGIKWGWSWHEDSTLNNSIPKDLIAKCRHCDKQLRVEESQTHYSKQTSVHLHCDHCGWNRNFLYDKDTLSHKVEEAIRERIKEGKYPKKKDRRGA